MFFRAPRYQKSYVCPGSSSRPLAAERGDAWAAASRFELVYEERVPDFRRLRRKHTIESVLQSSSPPALLFETGVPRSLLGLNQTELKSFDAWNYEPRRSQSSGFLRGRTRRRLILLIGLRLAQTRLCACRRWQDLRGAKRG